MDEKYTVAGGTGGIGLTEKHKIDLLNIPERIIRQNEELKRYPLWQWVNAQQSVHLTKSRWAQFWDKLSASFRR